MEEIKNFVDNIHNEAYKNAYSAPLIGAESLIMQGGRESGWALEFLRGPI